MRPHGKRITTSLKTVFVLPLLFLGMARHASAMAQSGGTFAATGDMATARYSHTATLLPDGRVLVAGGSPNEPASAELYDPLNGTFAATGEMTTGRASPA